MFRLTVGALALCLLLALRGTPTTTVPIEGPPPVEREARARAFLVKRGIDLQGYGARQIMVEQQAPVLYLQKILGAGELARRLARESLPLFYWQVHFGKPGTLRQYWVRVTIAGEVGAFTTRLTETDVGRRVGVDEARALARKLLTETHGARAHLFDEVEATTSVLRKRTDHRFVFARDLEGLGEAQERIAIAVQGGKVGGYRNWIKVPESFDVALACEDTYADALFWISVFADAILVIVAVGLLLGLWRGLGPLSEREAPARAALLVYGVLLLAIVNYVPVTLASDYSPEKPLAAFLLSHTLYLALMAAVPALGTFVMLLAGDTLTRAPGTSVPDRAATFRLWLAGRWADPAVLGSMGKGLILGMALGGGETLFYVVGQTWGPVVLPVGPSYVNSMSTWLPFLYPLSIGVAAAVTEECTFRLFATTLLTRVGAGRVLSLLLPAMAWAFAHSKESVFPVWVRGTELVIGGLLLGWFFLRTDLLAVVTAHYLYDVVAFGWPLLVSGQPVAALGAVAVIAVAAVPGILGLRQLRGLSAPARTGPSSDPPDART